MPNTPEPQAPEGKQERCPAKRGIHQCEYRRGHLGPHGVRWYISDPTPSSDNPERCPTCDETRNKRGFPYRSYTDPDDSLRTALEAEVEALRVEARYFATRSARRREIDMAWRDLAYAVTNNRCADRLAAILNPEPGESDE